jgi:hypothetical protein
MGFGRSGARHNPEEMRAVRGAIVDTVTAFPVFEPGRFEAGSAEKKPELAPRSRYLPSDRLPRRLRAWRAESQALWAKAEAYPGLSRARNRLASR